MHTVYPVHVYACMRGREGLLPNEDTWKSFTWCLLAYQCLFSPPVGPDFQLVNLCLPCSGCGLWNGLKPLLIGLTLAGGGVSLPWQRLTWCSAEGLFVNSLSFFFFTWNLDDTLGWENGSYSTHLCTTYMAYIVCRGLRVTFPTAAHCGCMFRISPEDLVCQLQEHFQVIAVATYN